MQLLYGAGQHDYCVESDQAVLARSNDDILPMQEGVSLSDDEKKTLDGNQHAFTARDADAQTLRSVGNDGLTVHPQARSVAEKPGLRGDLSILLP